jgi:hypothetical protein
MRAGLLGEFETPEAMLRAADELWKKGYRWLDAFTPYPVHGADRALRLRRSKLPWLALPFSIAGVALGYGVQWWCNAYDYPLDVGGRPPHSAPAFIPITFEMMVLATALSAVVIFLALARLPELYHPLFDVPGFERASVDRFWIVIDARDPTLVRSIAEHDLLELGALKVVWAGKEIS